MYLVYLVGYVLHAIIVGYACRSASLPGVFGAAEPAVGAGDRRVTARPECGALKWAWIIPRPAAHHFLLAVRGPFRIPVQLVLVGSAVVPVRHPFRDVSRQVVDRIGTAASLQTPDG